MEVEDYIKVWKSFGINSVEDYHRNFKEFCYNDSFKKNFEKVNYKNFWKASDIHFGTDPVCNHRIKGNIIDASKIGLDIKKIKDANVQNWKLANLSGVTGYFDLFSDNYKSRYGDSIPKMAEIGSGYGCIMDFLSDKNIDYTGFDLIPRFESVVEVDGEDGCLSDDQMSKYSNSFNLIYSFNVFQHLEKHQIEKYINQSYDLINKSEYGSVILGICLGSKSFHYGQLIELPTVDEFLEMISGKFKLLMCNKSYVIEHMGLHTLMLDIIR